MVLNESCWISPLAHDSSPLEVFLHTLSVTSEVLGDEKFYCYLSLDLDFILFMQTFLILHALDFLNMNSHGRKMVVLFCSGDYQKLISFLKKKTNHYSLHEVLDYQYKLPDSLLLH